MTKKQSKYIALPFVLKANADGSFPTEMQIAKTGSWRTPYHGNFDLTEADFDEAVANFSAGKYRVQETGDLAGTLDHLGGTSPAAFWITNVYRVGDTLWASITWTELGKEKLTRDEYRYVSFEYCTRANPMPNPENEDELFINVVTGATLTVDPLFKKLKPVLASARSESKTKEEGEDMDLTAIRAKKLEELSDEEKAFLEEHKTELTDEERAAFGITVEVEETEEEKATREAAEAKDAEDKAEADRKAAAEAEKLEASALKNMSLADLKQLKADAAAGRQASQDLLRERLTASIRSHVERGAVKTDQLEAGVELLMASSDAHRAKLTAFLSALPSNELLKAEAGSGKGADEDKDVELTAEEKSLGDDFGNTPEELAEYKKKQAEIAA